MRRLAPLIKCNDAATLSRQTSGLSPAHCELIRLLAKIAVDDYLRECDAPTGAGGQQ